MFNYKKILAIIFFILLALPVLGAVKKEVYDYDGYLTRKKINYSEFSAYNLTAYNNLTVYSLVNCNTIDTDASGLFTCGSDAVGGGAANINGTDISIAELNLSIINITELFYGNGSLVYNATNNNITVTGLSGFLDCSFITGTTDDLCIDTGGAFDPTNLILADIGNATRIYFAILTNKTDIYLSLDNNITLVFANITQILLNITSMNDTLGQKLDRGEVTNFDDSDLIAAIAGNVSSLEANDTAQYTNISNMNTSLGAKADRAEIILQVSLDEIIAGIAVNITRTEGHIDNNVTMLRNELGDNVTSLESSINLNFTLLQGNITQILVNISAMNTSLGKKLESTTVGNKLENATDATFVWLNATTLNVTSNVYLADMNLKISTKGMNITYGYNISGNVNMTGSGLGQNVSGLDCIIFFSGGQICSGT